MRRSYMYLRPGNLYKDFIIEGHTESVGKTGRPTTSYSSKGDQTLRGALAEATPKQKMEWKAVTAPDHPYDCPGWKAAGKAGG